MITPNDIETKVFSYSMRGYNKQEVDEFLDQIMIDYQSLLDQNEMMMERIGELQNRTADQSVDNTTSKTVNEAKHIMNDISKSAEKRAELIIQNAEQDAAAIVSNAKNSTTQASEDVEKLRRKIEKFKTRYKSMLEKEIERVDDESEDILEDLQADFYPNSVLEDDPKNVTRATGVGIPDDTLSEPDLGDFAPEKEQREKNGDMDDTMIFDK